MYRWYGLDTFQEMVKNEQKDTLFLQEIAEGEDPVFLMQFYEVLYDTLVFQLELVTYILGLQTNPMDLLFQYNTKVT